MSTKRATLAGRITLNPKRQALLRFILALTQLKKATAVLRVHFNRMAAFQPHDYYYFNSVAFLRAFLNDIAILRARMNWST